MKNNKRKRHVNGLARKETKEHCTPQPNKSLLFLFFYSFCLLRLLRLLFSLVALAASLLRLLSIQHSAEPESIYQPATVCLLWVVACSVASSCSVACCFFQRQQAACLRLRYVTASFSTELGLKRGLRRRGARAAPRQRPRAKKMKIRKQPGMSGKCSYAYLSLE